MYTLFSIITKTSSFSGAVNFSRSVLHVQVGDMSMAVEALLVFHFLELVVNTQFLVDVLLVDGHENGSAQECVHGEEAA